MVVFLVDKVAVAARAEAQATMSSCDGLRLRPAVAQQWDNGDSAPGGRSDWGARAQAVWGNQADRGGQLEAIGASRRGQLGVIRPAGEGKVGVIRLACRQRG